MYGVTDVCTEKRKCVRSNRLVYGEVEVSAEYQKRVLSNRRVYGETEVWMEKWEPFLGCYFSGYKI